MKTFIEQQEGNQGSNKVAQKTQGTDVGGAGHIFKAQNP